MSGETLRLVRPTLDRTDEYAEMARESVVRGETFLSGWFGYLGVPRGDWAGLIVALQQLEQPSADPQRVVSSTWWLERVDDGQLLGELHLRHCLTPALLHHGGHIGYFVRPTQRRRGYGGQLCALGLVEARRIGLPRVLITCDQANRASARIIMANGGQLEETCVSRSSGQLICRFWVDLGGREEGAAAGRIDD